MLSNKSENSELGGLQRVLKIIPINPRKIGGKGVLLGSNLESGSLYVINILVVVAKEGS